MLPSRIELLSMVLQTTAMTTSAKAALGCLMRIELILSRSQREVQTTTLRTPLEQSERIELSTEDWKSAVLPLN